MVCKSECPGRHLERLHTEKLLKFFSSIDEWSIQPYVLLHFNSDDGIVSCDECLISFNGLSFCVESH